MIASMLFSHLAALWESYVTPTQWHPGHQACKLDEKHRGFRRDKYDSFRVPSPCMLGRNTSSTTPSTTDPSAKQIEAQPVTKILPSVPIGIPLRSGNPHLPGPTLVDPTERPKRQERPEAGLRPHTHGVGQVAGTPALLQAAAIFSLDCLEQDLSTGTGLEDYGKPVWHLVERISQLLQATSLLEVKLQSESRYQAQLLRSEESLECPVPEFALSLGVEMAKVGCRTALRRVSDTKQYWSRSMRNTFVLCILPGASGRPVAVVVDPNFKEQFRTAHMTPRYRDILDAAPDIFIGQGPQLMLLTHLLCCELALNFEILGQMLPPWRAYKACIGRWMSASVTDIMVPLPCPGPGPSGHSAPGPRPTPGESQHQGRAPLPDPRCPRVPLSEECMQEFWTRVHAMAAQQPAARFATRPGQSTWSSGTARSIRGFEVVAAASRPQLLLTAP